MKRSGFSWAAVLSLAFAMASGCSKGSEPQPALPNTETAAYRASTQPNLQWKRYAALEADLTRALELAPEELCNELGRASCIHEVHLVPLGGNDPFATGLLEPSAEPLATTPTAIDRVLLSACGQRVALDRAAGPQAARVFGALDLEGDAPEPGHPSVTETVSALYRRLLARDPDAHELPLVAALTRDQAGKPVPAADFATLSCFAIGSTTEFLFF